MDEYRSYVDWEFGQLHFRQWGRDKRDKPPIFCLAPSPFSSIAYGTLAPLLAERRHVIALDYPGFGNSSPMPGWPTISDYARAALTIANHVSPQAPLIFLGFHSGTLVATETALTAPDRVDQLFLIDIPFFEEEKRLAYLHEKSAPTPITSDMAMLEPAWNLCVASRDGLIPLPRAYENFVDMIASGERLNATYRAAFSYDSANALPKIDKPATFIATRAGLFDETRRASETTPAARLVTLEEITVAVLDKGAQSIADVVNRVLD